VRDRSTTDLIADCTEALEQVEPELRAHGLDYECLRLGGLSAAQALQEAAQADDVALLVVGSGRRPLLGSTAQRLLHGAPCPVVAVPRDHETDALRAIAAAVRGVDADHQTLTAAHALAVRAGAQLRVITVVRVTPAMYAETQESTTIRPARTIEDVCKGREPGWAHR
jgi:phosphoribosylanthranilate isomerase